MMRKQITSNNMHVRRHGRRFLLQMRLQVTSKSRCLLVRKLLLTIWAIHPKLLFMILVSKRRSARKYLFLAMLGKLHYYPLLTRLLVMCWRAMFLISVVAVTTCCLLTIVATMRGLGFVPFLWGNFRSFQSEHELRLHVVARVVSLREDSAAFRGTLCICILLLVRSVRERSMLSGNMREWISFCFKKPGMMHLCTTASAIYFSQRINATSTIQTRRTVVGRSCLPAVAFCRNSAK